MKKILLILPFVIASLGASAQEFLELTVSPNFSSRILSSDNSQLKDSLDNADKVRKSIGFGIGASFNLNESMALTTGLRYNDYGFTRVWEDLQFHDVVHPDIGRIEDLSQAAQKDAFFFHKFRYLEIPIRINFQLSKKRNNQQYRIYAHAGLVNQIFLEEEFKAFFKGFSVGGERTYTGISTGYTMKSFNLTSVFGARFIYRISPDFWVTAQPELSIPFAEHNEGDESTFRLTQFSGNFGIAFVLP
jgi:hypothetical protein